MKFTDYLPKLKEEKPTFRDFVKLPKFMFKELNFLRLKSRYYSKISDDISIHLFKFPTEEQTLIKEGTIEGLLYSRHNLPSVKRTVNTFYVEPKDKYIGVNFESKNYKKLLKYATRHVDSIEDTPQLVVKNHQQYYLLNKELPASAEQIAHSAIMSSFILTRAFSEEKGVNVLFQGDESYGFPDSKE